MKVFEVRYRLGPYSFGFNQFFNVINMQLAKEQRSKPQIPQSWAGNVNQRLERREYAHL